MDSNTFIGIIGAIIGGIIAGAAMILNSYFSTKFSSKQADQEKKRERLEKDIEETQKFYENALHLSDKLIRNEGMASETELEEFYRQEIRLGLISNKEVLKKFRELKSDIANFAHKLPKMPEEFIPKFEDDDDRRWRLEKRKKAKQKREKEAKKYRPDLYKKHSELANLMQGHLQGLK
ncbi:MAG: hypothetical protein PHG69_00050 [Candidatus Omnitrophica bacterium]|nr:hypothetical protein [Candidatus Omnitrophota bacterium]